SASAAGNAPSPASIPSSGRHIPVSAIPVALAANDTGGMSRETRIVTNPLPGSSGAGTHMGGVSAVSRARGIGNRFRPANTSSSETFK
ncbi:MAG: hypothetical protein ACK5NN_06035, partial [Sphingomonadaceae bacterium]